MPTAAPFELKPPQRPQALLNPALPSASGAGQPAELIFEHQRSWRTSQLLWGLSVTAIFTPPMLLAYIVGGLETSFLLVVGLLSALLAFGFVYNIDVTGEWRIQVTKDEITWKAPNNVHGNKGFRVKISEIETIISERIGENSSITTRHYHVVMKNGEQHRNLYHAFSGMDFEGFCNALQKAGVAHCRHP